MSLFLRTCLTLLTAVVIASAMSSQVVLGQAEQSHLLKVITHNVWYGFTEKPEPRHGEWKQWMARQSPDVVSLQELNGFSANDLAEGCSIVGALVLRDSQEGRISDRNYITVSNFTCSSNSGRVPPWPVAMSGFGVCGFM